MGWMGQYELERALDHELRREHGIGTDEEQPADAVLEVSESFVGRCLAVDMLRAPWARDKRKERLEREEMEGRE